MQGNHVIVKTSKALFYAFHPRENENRHFRGGWIGIRLHLKISPPWCERGLTINSVSSEALSYSYFHRPL